MKAYKKFTVLLFAVLLAAALACGVHAAGTDVPATAFALNDEKLTIYLDADGKARGENNVLGYALQPYDCTASVSFESSDTSVVKVASDGTLTPITEGTAEITAAVSDVFDGSSLSSVCTVTVAEDAIGSFTLEAEKTSVSGKNPVQLTAVTEYLSGLTDEGAYYASSDPTVAAVTSQGLVVPLRSGSVTITAYSAVDLSRTDTVTITFVDSIAGVRVTNEQTADDALQVSAGSQLQLTADIIGETFGEKDLHFTWSVSDGNVAAVDVETGLLTAGETAGECTLTVTETTYNKSATLALTVTENPLRSVSMDDAISLRTGESAEVTARTVMTEKSDLSCTWLWISSNESVVTVSGENENAVLTAVAEGSATVTVSVSCGDVTVTASMDVTVAEPVTGTTADVHIAVSASADKYFLADPSEDDGPSALGALLDAVSDAADTEIASVSLELDDSENGDIAVLFASDPDVRAAKADGITCYATEADLGAVCLRISAAGMFRVHYVAYDADGNAVCSGTLTIEITESGDEDGNTADAEETEEADDTAEAEDTNGTEDTEENKDTADAEEAGEDSTGDDSAQAEKSSEASDSTAEENAEPGAGNETEDGSSGDTAASADGQAGDGSAAFSGIYVTDLIGNRLESLGKSMQIIRLRAHGIRSGASVMLCAYDADGNLLSYSFFQLQSSSGDESEYAAVLDNTEGTVASVRAVLLPGSGSGETALYSMLLK